MASYKFFIIALVLIGAWAASASPIEEDDAEENAMDERGLVEEDEAEENAMDERGLDEYEEEMSEIDEREEEEVEEESDMEERQLPKHCLGKAKFLFRCHMSEECKKHKRKTPGMRQCRRKCKTACDKTRKNICYKRCDDRCTLRTQKTRCKDLYCKARCNIGCMRRCR